MATKQKVVEPTNGCVFMLYNKSVSHARIAQPSGNLSSVISTQREFYPDQYWYLEAEPDHPGYFYIKNAYRSQYRLTAQNENFICFNGDYYNDQLWKFQKEGSYYRIFNLAHPQKRITLFSHDGNKMGTFDGPDYDDQLWRLDPKYKASVNESIIWSNDNRTGSRDFSETRIVTHGMKLTRSASLSTTLGFEETVKLAVKENLGVESGTAESSTKINGQISGSITAGSEESWSSSSQIKFTAPAGKNYRVLQTHVELSTAYPADACVYNCHYRVEETAGEFPR